MIKKIKILVTIAVLVSMIIIAQLHQTSLSKKNNQYFKRFNLQFSGIVFEKDSIEKNGGIVRLRKITSTIPTYDISDQEDLYFCVIKNGKAELLTIFIDRFSINDSVFVDGVNDSLYVYDNLSKLKYKAALKNMIIDSGPLAINVKRRQKL